VPLCHDLLRLSPCSFDLYCLLVFLERGLNSKKRLRKKKKKKKLLY